MTVLLIIILILIVFLLITSERRQFRGLDFDDLSFQDFVRIEGWAENESYIDGFSLTEKFGVSNTAAQEILTYLYVKGIIDMNGVVKKDNSK